MKAIVYVSQTGFTQKYAQLLAEQDRKMLDLYLNGGDCVREEALEEALMKL